MVVAKLELKENLNISQEAQFILLKYQQKSSIPLQKHYKDKTNLFSSISIVQESKPPLFWGLSNAL